MPLLIVRNDITKMRVDAIVNAANPSLLGGGGVDGAIHRAAGPGLLAECKTLGGCKVGEAKATRGYRLPCRFVIHTVGPIWRGGFCGEREQLEACYRNSLAVAMQVGCETVAFPLISAGAYGYPREEALRVALDTVNACTETETMTVYIVLFDSDSYRQGRQLFPDIAAYIDDNYVDPESLKAEQNERRRLAKLFARKKKAEDAGAPAQTADHAFEAESAEEVCEGVTSEPYTAAGREKDECCAVLEDALPHAAYKPAAYPQAVLNHANAPEYSLAKPHAAAQAKPSSEEETTQDLTRILSELDESFSQMLLRKIDESGMTDSECYKRANVDRKLFSKIRSNAHYSPSKRTALAFALALELSLPEARELLSKAGYALSRSSKFDVIIEYHIVNRIYNVLKVNEVLYAFDQPLLGA